MNVMILCMNFGMIVLNQSIKTMQNYVTWIRKALLFILKLKIFMKILQMMFKNGLIHHFMKSIDHCLLEKNKKYIGLMEDKIGGKIMTEFAALRPKTYSYLMDDGDSNKEAKETKMCVIKRKLKFNDYISCLINN